MNLYPFERVSRARGVEDDEVIENIDIGGPTLIRAAAKNHAFAAVVVTPESYDAVLDGAAQESDGHAVAAHARRASRSRRSRTPRATTRRSRAGSRSARRTSPSQYTRSFEKVLDLPYGENPHQRAAYYAEAGARTHLMSMVSKLHGKELSFNNLLDLDSGRRLIEDFELPAAAIIKHNNPCGAAVGATLGEAFDSALATDPQSAFGGVFCFNRPVDRPLAEKLERAVRRGRVRARLRRGRAARCSSRSRTCGCSRTRSGGRSPIAEHDIKRVRGGMLVQDRDTGLEEREEMRGRHGAQADRGGVGRAAVRDAGVQARALERDRAVAAGSGTVGIGAGQMSRVDSVRIAVDKAAAGGQSLDGAVLASDAFFPFADGPQLAIDAGVRAIIQPGGSQRDQEVVEACDAAGIAMVFTARRHFRH